MTYFHDQETVSQPRITARQAHGGSVVGATTPTSPERMKSRSVCNHHVSPQGPTGLPVDCGPLAGLRQGKA
jgi:hypothetical protein